MYHAGNARQASDGKDVGVDFDQLYYAIYGVGTPPPPTPTPLPTSTPTPTPISTPSPGGAIPVQGYVFGNNVRLSGAIVTISVAGNVQQTKITDQFGFYSFNSVAIESTIVPSIDGYNFSPEVVNALTANYNFNGTPGGTAAVSRKPIDEFFFELGFQGTGMFVYGFYRWLVG